MPSVKLTDEISNVTTYIVANLSHEALVAVVHFILSELAYILESQTLKKYKIEDKNDIKKIRDEISFYITILFYD